MQKRFILLTIFGSLAIVFSAAAFLRAATPAPAGSGYHVIKTIPVGGEGGWDYVYVDSAARRVYVSRGTHVVVLDADTYAVVGDIPDTQGVHGIAVASDLGRGFTSNGRADSVTIFDLKTLKPIGTVKTDGNPDAILYDSVSKRVFTFNGRGKNATAINAADGSVVGTIPLNGKPEFATADGKGTVYVNNEDTSDLYHLDAQSLKELHHWPLAPCKSPSGLAMDVANRRLFSVCDEKVMAVVNADTGKVVERQPSAKVRMPPGSITRAVTLSPPAATATSLSFTKTRRTNSPSSKMFRPSAAPARWASTSRPTTSFSQLRTSIRLLLENAEAK